MTNVFLCASELGMSNPGSAEPTARLEILFIETIVFRNYNMLVCPKMSINNYFSWLWITVMEKTKIITRIVLEDGKATSHLK